MKISYNEQGNILMKENANFDMVEPFFPPI